MMRFLKQSVRTVLGEDLTFDLRKYYLARKLRRGLYAEDEPEMGQLHRFVRPGSTALDVGANVGFYARALSQLAGPDGHVHAFEPVPRTYGLLTHNVRAFPCQNVVTYNAALSEQAGTARIVIPPVGMQGIYRASLSTDGTEAGEAFTVPVLTIDELASAHFPTVDFIKIDVEGAELPALRGGGALLDAQHPTILCEVGDGSKFGYTPADLFAWLADLGYAASFCLNGELTPCDGPDQRNPGPNYFFVHPNRQP